MEQSNQPLLAVRGLRTHFFTDDGIVRAVDGISFDVVAGKTVAIVGESGCGKSVAVRSILGIVDPPGRVVEGQILLRRRLNGQNEVTDLATLGPNSKAIREIRGKEISLIFQEPMASFSPVHTVGDQIIEAIRVHRKMGRQQAREQGIQILRKTGVPQAELRIDDYPHQLSGGILQRCMIAMALSCEPHVLIADEPTTALDVTTQAQILSLLKELQQQTAMSIIFITHDLGVVAEMADIVVVMYLGQVMEIGPADQVYHDPKHPYTRALLRSIPSIRGHTGKRLESIAGSIPHPLQRPSGCPFHDRCKDFITGSCDRIDPKPVQVQCDHEVSCFLYK